ncbi:MAG: hypothetical protein LUH51_08995 [Firmicutes bacterium]|nr:hypothetical protein [Bacillota bacterium]
MKEEKMNCGSITLEAAMVVPMFIILMLLVNGLIVMFMGQQIMSHTLIQSAKSLAFDPYSSQRVSANDEDDLADMFIDIFSFAGGNHVSTDAWYEGDLNGVDELVEDRFVAYLRGAESEASALIEQIGVKGGLGGLDFSGSTVEDGILTVKMKYTQEFIFNAAGLAEFERELCVKVKLFEYAELQ